MQLFVIVFVIITVTWSEEPYRVLSGMDNQIKADAEQVRPDDPLKSSGHDTDSSLDKVTVMMINLLNTHLQWANLMKENFYDQVYTLLLII